MGSFMSSHTDNPQTIHVSSPYDVLDHVHWGNIDTSTQLWDVLHAIDERCEYRNRPRQRYTCTKYTTGYAIVGQHLNDPATTARELARLYSLTSFIGD